MKITTTLMLAAGLTALAACNQSPKENVADNIEANASNVADNIEANADNTADAVRAAGDNKADAVRADADTNTANKN